jgi:hypothetical protein
MLMGRHVPFPLVQVWELPTVAASQVADALTCKLRDPLPVFCASTLWVGPLAPVFTVTCSNVVEASCNVGVACRDAAQAVSQPVQRSAFR